MGNRGLASGIDGVLVAGIQAFDGVDAEGGLPCLHQIAREEGGGIGDAPTVDLDAMADSLIIIPSPVTWPRI